MYPAKKGSKLSDREKGICDLLASGASGKEAAAKLGLNNRTISSHKERIFAKAGVENDVQLGQWLASQDSDGVHTFDELYDHRITLWIALCRTLDRSRSAHVWRSKTHSDASSIPGWFVLGVGALAGHQITYHVPVARWDETNFASTLEKAPEFDGHTPADVLERLKAL